MNEKVSVIMGIYNCEETLSRAIDSIVNQTYTNWELIMCDDASTDNTYSIAKEYEKKYPNKIIVLKNEKNMRLAASLNRCLEVATGKYIARMDADDISFLNRLEKEINYMKMNPNCDCVGTGRIIFDEKGNKYISISKEIPTKESMLYGVPFAHPTIMMKKSVYDDLHGYSVCKDTMRAEDADLWFRFFENNYKGYVIQEPLYFYKESTDDYKKRNLKAAIGTTKVFLKGYKKLNFEKYKYIFALKPLIAALLPNKFMKRYHMKGKKKVNDIHI